MTADRNTGDTPADHGSAGLQPLVNSGVRVSRRTLATTVAAAGAAVIAGAGLAACGNDSGSGAASANASIANSSTNTSPGSTAPSVSGTVLGGKSEIPVGGGKIFADQNVVVTQPTAGTFKAFTAICTHLGCEVYKVHNGLIECPCHGSEFSIADGSAKVGPAQDPLSAVPITTEGNSIILQN